MISQTIETVRTSQPIRQHVMDNATGKTIVNVGARAPGLQGRLLLPTQSLLHRILTSSTIYHQSQRLFFYRSVALRLC